MMKNLAILGVILGIILLYFIVNAEKSVFLKGSEAIPAGTDIPKLIFNKVKSTMPKISGIIDSKKMQKNLTETTDSQSITNMLKNRVAALSQNAISGLISSIQKPIENKISELICPAK